MTFKTSLNCTSDRSDQVMLIHKSLLNKHIFLISDLIIMGLIITGISIFQNNADKVLLIFWFIVAIYCLSFRRYRSFFHLIISTFIAILWVFVARNNYDYNYTYYTIAGMNILAILSWALGMTGVSEVFNHFIFKKEIVRFLVFVLIFWIVLIIIETYAFHVIAIRNTASGNSIGLPLCNCIHAPWWMRMVYFTMGPAYYGITIIADKYYEFFK